MRAREIWKVFFLFELAAGIIASRQHVAEFIKGDDSFRDRLVTALANKGTLFAPGTSAKMTRPVYENSPSVISYFHEPSPITNDYAYLVRTVPELE